MGAQGQGAGPGRGLNGEREKGSWSQQDREEDVGPELRFGGREMGASGLQPSGVPMGRLGLLT